MNDAASNGRCLAEKLAAMVVIGLSLNGCTLGSTTDSAPSVETTVLPTATVTTKSVGPNPSPAPTTAVESAATPTTKPASKPQGSSADFDNFKVTVSKLDRPTESQVLVLAKVCVKSLPPDSPGNTTRVSWAPWSVVTDSGVVQASLVGDAPQPTFARDDTYRIGECASGWIPFRSNGEVNKVSYVNGVGDTAVWNARRLDAKPTVGHTTPASPPPSTAESTKPPSSRKKLPTPTRAPTWDGDGYTKAHYKDRVSQIPKWIGLVRKNSADGMTMTVGVDLTGLGHRFEEVSALPAPPGVNPAHWHASTTTLADFSELAADEWISGDETKAMARFEVIVKNSNELVKKVNTAFDLQIPRSR